MLTSSVMFAQTNTSPFQTVCAGSLAEPYLINPPTAGSTYQWSITGGGIINLGSTTDNITVDWGMIPGVYTITVIETDVSGCQGNPVTVEVTLISNPVVVAVDLLNVNLNLIDLYNMIYFLLVSLLIFC